MFGFTIRFRAINVVDSYIHKTLPTILVRDDPTLM